MAAIRTFKEFWPYYVGEHRSPLSRRLHFLGTLSSLICITALIVTRHWWWIPIALVTSYGPAWIGHFFIEKNRPATFKYPLYSLLADYCMFGLMCTGRMQRELARLGLAGAPLSDVRDSV